MLNRLFVPDTLDYMIAGYVVLTVILGIYISSIVIRWKKAAAELSSYQEE
jgi:hypothetical protein